MELDWDFFISLIQGIACSSYKAGAGGLRAGGFGFGGFPWRGGSFGNTGNYYWTGQSTDT